MSKQKLPVGVPQEGVGAPQGHEAPPPPFGVGKPVEAPKAGPQIVDQLSRAPEGFTRFKIRCDNYSYRATKYVLAQDRKDAESFYIANSPLATELEQLKAAGADKIDPPKLIVTVLSD